MATDMHSAYSGGPDPAAYDRWQRAWSHREQLLKVARRRSMSMEDAEDAVHEAMLRAAENPHLDDERLGAWLTTVTMRLCVDRYRQVNREAEVRSSPRLAAPCPVPVEEAVCDRAEAKWLARRSGELPARQAEALWLKSEDLDVGQVAMKMGLSYRTVESLLARARRTLRNSLAATLGLALWLCGRGRPRAGGNAQAVAAASTAATLVVAGFVLPYVGGWDGPGSTQPAAPTVSQAADSRTPHSGRSMSPAAESLPAATPAAPGTGSPGDGALVIPSLQDLPLPPLPLTTPGVPEVPRVPQVPVPEVPVPAVSVPSVPKVPAPTVSVPAVPEVPVPSASVPVDVPETQDVTVEVPGDALHTGMHTGVNP
jgi:RNA polymerase sigma factor (sigma-70 family)